MAVPDHSIDPKILESARNEFLSKGFQKASLKEICGSAGVTTGPFINGIRAKKTYSVLL